MRLSPASLARSAAAHPWRTIGIWVAALLVAVVLSSRLLGDALTTDTDFTNEPDAKRAAALVEERLGEANEGTEFVVVTGPATVDDPLYRGYVDELQQTIASLGPEVVDNVGSYLTAEGAVSDD